MLEHFSLITLAFTIFLSSCSQAPINHTTTHQRTTSPIITSVQPSPEFLTKPPQKIAIIVLKLNPQYYPYRQIEDIFITTLISKGFRVVSRSDVEPLLREMEFQRRSGLTDKDAAELGRMLNVPAVMIVAITRYDSDPPYTVALGARLVSVEEAEIPDSTGFSGRQRSLSCQGQLDSWFSVHTLSATTQPSVKIISAISMC